MKKALTLLLTLVLFLGLVGCGHQHDWQEATCLEKAICKECKEEKEGSEPLGHDWIKASCEKAKHCSRCNETEGVKLPHTFADATCTQGKVCTQCGYEESEALGHDLKDWKVIKKSTCSEHGIDILPTTKVGGFMSD